MIGFVYLVDLFLNEPQKFYVGKNQMYLGKVKA
jgi:hypothetical protein